MPPDADTDVNVDELEVEQQDDQTEPEDQDEPAGETDDQTGDQDADEDQDEPAEQAAGSQQRSEEQQPTGRASRRITAQQDELRKRDQQIADLNRRLDAVLTTTTVKPPQETLEQREQRLALLDPVERIRVEMHEAQQASQRQITTMAFTMQDQGDKAGYDAKALVDPLYSRWAPKVESELTALRAKGQNVPRETMLKYLIGEAALSGRKVSGGQQRKAAGERMARNRTRPGNSRSDAQGERRGGSESGALEKRLENIQI